MILVAIKTASAALSPTPPLKKARSARTTQHQPTPDRNIGERPLRASSSHSLIECYGTWLASSATRQKNNYEQFPLQQLRV
jgi:hypothetical protein